MGIAISNKRGFSLLEVMIALAIVAIALVSLLALGNRSVLMHAEQQDLTRATLLAEKKMTEIETLYRLGRMGEIENEGEFPEPFDRYRWRVSSEDTVLPSVQQVTVRVLWGAEERIEFVDLTSFVTSEGGGV